MCVLVVRMGIVIVDVNSFDIYVCMFIGISLILVFCFWYWSIHCSCS